MTSSRDRQLLDLRGTTALVTGASSGIGRELGREFARRGANVVLVARRKARLDELAEELVREFGVEARVQPVDLLAPGAVADLLAQLAADGVTTDHLVNNAGFGICGGPTSVARAAARSMTDLNVGVLTELTYGVLAGMVERGRGGILQVASVAGFSPLPYMAAYAATKAYVLSFSRALSLELEGTGVHVTALCPGHVETEFQAVAGYEDGARVPGHLSAEETARIGVRAYVRRRPEVVPGAINGAAVRLGAFVPTGVKARVGRMILRRVGRTTD